MSTTYTVHLAGRRYARSSRTSPRTVTSAMVEFFNGALRENPHRVGHALRNDLEGLRSARRGSFRAGLPAGPACG